MRSAIPLLVATSFLTALLGAAAAPTTGALPEHERRLIADLAQRYLQHRADKVTNTPRPPGFGVPTAERTAAELHDDEIRLVARRNRYLATDAYACPNTSFSLTHVLVFDRTITGWALATDSRPPGTTCKIPAETEFRDRSGER